MGPSATLAQACATGPWVGWHPDAIVVADLLNLLDFVLPGGGIDVCVMLEPGGEPAFARVPPEVVATALRSAEAARW